MDRDTHPEMFDRTKYFSATQLARLAGISRNTVCYWIAKNKLKAVKIGPFTKSRWFIDKNDAMEFLKVAPLSPEAEKALKWEPGLDKG